MPHARNSPTTVQRSRGHGSPSAPTRASVIVADQRPSAVAQRQQVSRRSPAGRGRPRSGPGSPLCGSDAAPSTPPGRIAPLPRDLKAGIEALSGMSMDSVRVHHDSARPMQLGALAYAQGHDIHLGPGQERHLPHEAWHVVQQAEGRVAATAQYQGRGPFLNDDTALEREADAMGQKAQQRAPAPRPRPLVPLRQGGAALQRKLIVGFEPDKATDYKRTDAKTLLKILEDVDAAQLGHAGFARHDEKKRLLIVRDYIARETEYAMRQVKETRVDPKTQASEHYWWKFSAGDKAVYSLYAYETWQAFFDTLFGGAQAEQKAPSDAWARWWSTKTSNTVNRRRWSSSWSRISASTTRRSRPRWGAWSAAARAAAT